MSQGFQPKKHKNKGKPGFAKGFHSKIEILARTSAEEIESMTRRAPSEELPSGAKRVIRQQLRTS